MTGFVRSFVVLLFFACLSAHAATRVVVDATERRAIGGMDRLDRARYFNHWGTHVIERKTNLGDLQTEIWATDGLNSATGRDTWEFDAWLAEGVPEDPNRPGYFDLEALTARFRDGTYREFLLYSPRYESLRKQENPVLVQSGRAGGDWPDWLLAGTTMPMSHQGAAYAEFLITYLDEVVYGTGHGQGYLPVDKERFYIEIINEPQLELKHGVTWDDIYTFHKTVTLKVKERFPQAQLGGIADGEAPFPEWNPHRWEPVKRLMDHMTTWANAAGEPVTFDFWTFHPYDVHHVRADGDYEHQVRQSPGHNNGILDLFETYSHIKFGSPKKFAITEYGAFIHSSKPDDDFGNYTREERQWDMMVAVKEKLLVFLERPDRIINATPFVCPRYWNDGEGAHYAMWERDERGDWHETILGGMYRMFNGVRGSYIKVASDNDNLQVAAFRDRGTLHVALNNLCKEDQPARIDAVLGPASVTHAALDRVWWDAKVGIYGGGIDVTSSWQDLVLTPEEGAVLTLTLSEEPPVEIFTDMRTYYGDDVQTPIDQAGSTSKIIHIDADTDGALSAIIRVGVAEREDVWNETFSIVVNGLAIEVPATGDTGYDDGDPWLFSRTADVPLEYLANGTNEVLVDFDSDGGELVTAILVLTHRMDVSESQ